jgi:hypothetical protein
MCSFCEDVVFSRRVLANDHTRLTALGLEPPASNGTSVYKHVHAHHGEQVPAATPRSRNKRHGQERSVDKFSPRHAYRATETIIAIKVIEVIISHISHIGSVVE